MPVRHDVRQQFLQLLDFNFTRRDQPLPGISVGDDCSDGIVYFMSERRREFAHQSHAPHSRKLHSLTLVLELRLFARGDINA